MRSIKNIVIPGPNEKPVVLDVFFNETHSPKPILIYAHGFNGFKDWGGFDLLAAQAADAGFFFVKFNFSHNGTSAEFPEEFCDLEAYAENNYTKELDDLKAVVDWVYAKNDYNDELDANRIGLIGHSMGGGIAIIYSAEDRRIKALTTWAAISKCATPWTSWPESQLTDWRESGVAYVLNSRTQQQMPLNYQLYENYVENERRLDIPAAIARLKIPVLICHGTDDTSVPFSSAKSLHAALHGSELFVIQSDHVFGRKHPWTEPEPPHAMQQVMDKTIEFFARTIKH